MVRMGGGRGANPRERGSFSEHSFVLYISTYKCKEENNNLTLSKIVELNDI